MDFWKQVGSNACRDQRAPGSACFDGATLIGVTAETRIEYAPSDIHFVNGRYYGVYGYLTFSSADGIDWTTESSGTLLNFDRISSLNGILLAGGSQVIRKSTAAPVNLPPQPLALHPAVELRFMGVDSVSYNIEVSTDLEHWSAIEYGITGHGGMIRRFYSTENQPQRYFRVVTP